MLNWLNVFRKHRIKLLRKEVKETEKLIEMQQTLNDLLKEENEITQG